MARTARNNKKRTGGSCRLLGSLLLLLAMLSLLLICTPAGQASWPGQHLAELGMGQYFVPVTLLVAGIVFSAKGSSSKRAGSSIVDMEEVRRRAQGQETEAELPPQRTEPRRQSSRPRGQQSSPAEVYKRDEFADFAEGIKKESPFKRILNFGAAGETVYDKEPERRLLQEDPVQPPDWLESGARSSRAMAEGGVNRVLRPVIDYDAGVKELKKESLTAAKAEPHTDGAAAKTAAQAETAVTAKAVPPADQDKPKAGSGIIKNTYRYGEPDQPRFTYIDSDDVLEVAAAGEEVPWHAVPQTYERQEELEDDILQKFTAKAAVANASEQAQNAEPQEVMAQAEALAQEQDAEEYVDAAQDTETQADVLTEAEQDVMQEEAGYRLPPLELLNATKATDPAAYESDIRSQCAVLEQTLADFRVKARVTAVTRGPSVTRFELEPAPGVKVASVVNLADDIALRLAASGVRIEAPIPGKSAIGVEAPNTKNDSVALREVVDAECVSTAASKLCVGLGKDISGNIITADLAKMPHLLVAGSTGSGKSVCINTLIAGVLYKARPDEVKLILVDPKVVELTNYNGIPHLLTPVVTEPKKAASALHWAVAEMERRYQAFAEEHVREIKSYNAKAKKQGQAPLPYIVIIIDELSDLMMVAKVDVEEAILRLAQKARAAGIHLVVATQRPSTDVITGIIKANIPARIAFAVSSQVDSRTILGMGGAEKLLGKGDMLFAPIGQNKPVRVQGAFVSDEELARIVDFIVSQSVPAEYSEEVTSQPLASDAKADKEAAKEDGGAPQELEDELFEDAVRLVLDMGQASASMLQRRFRIGYTRAARLVDTMEELGIVGQTAGSKPREVIISRQEAEERFLTQP